MTDTRDFVVSVESAGVRLDKFLVAMLPEFSRSEIQHFTISRNGKNAKFSDKVKPDDKITVIIPDAPTDVATDNISDDIDLDILYISSAIYFSSFLAGTVSFG